MMVTSRTQMLATAASETIAVADQNGELKFSTGLVRQQTTSAIADYSCS